MAVNFNIDQGNGYGSTLHNIQPPALIHTTAILNVLIRLNYWVSIWILILFGTHTHNAFQANLAIILSKTTIACRRSPNTVTTLLFNQSRP